MKTDKRYKELGDFLLQLRKEKFPGKGLKQVAPLLDIEYSYLNKLENGLQKPSLSLLHRIRTEYNLDNQQQQYIFKYSGYGSGVISVDNSKSNVDSKQGNQSLSIDPNKTPVFYVDNINISANNFGFVVDFSQRVALTNNFNVVARVGMSEQHVQVFVEQLSNLIKKRKYKGTVDSGETKVSA